MAGVFDQVRKKVLEEVRNRKTQPAPESPNGRAKALGLFVTECLHNRKMSRKDFAEALQMEPELADAILDGVLPESELNNDLLAEISDVLSYESPILHLMMGRLTTGRDAAASV